MILQLDIERLRSLDEVQDFMAGSAPVDFRFLDRADAYGFVRRVLVRFRYVRLSRPDKGLIRRFLIKVTGFSRAQVSRLISQFRIDCADGSNSRASWSGLRPDRTRSTICCRYSGAYRAIDRDIVNSSSSKNEVSTEPGQPQDSPTAICTVFASRSPTAGAG